MNPEPMHAFIDAFVIGEGEEVIHDIVNAVKAAKTTTVRPAMTPCLRACPNPRRVCPPLL